MMEAEVAKMQQAMAIQQTGALPMPWDGASPPPGRVRTAALKMSRLQKLLCMCTICSFTSCSS